MSRRMKEADAILERCTECMVCIEECAFLAKFCKSPKELARRFAAGDHKQNPLIPYSCNLCELCLRVCPEDLSIGRMCLQARQNLVAEGLAPLRAHRYVKEDQDFAVSGAFSLLLPDPAVEKSRRLFFPGCSLSGYSPALVIKTFDYLRDRLPGTGILLGCCGDPTLCVGENAKFQMILEELETGFERSGASELILACPTCLRVLKRHAPRVPLRTLYEVMVEIGLPEIPCKDEHTFSLHDSCATRWEKNLQDSVRKLIGGMGYRIEEMQHTREWTRCCGMGGMIFYTNFDLANRVSQNRTREAGFDILTYCATCREVFAEYKPANHILDLIFNPAWEKDREKGRTNIPTKRKNQALLKSRLLERVM